MHALAVANQYILWLDVTVDDRSFLQVDQCFHNLSNHEFGFTLIKVLLSPQSLEQVAALTVFQHSIDVLFIVKVAIESYYVWVVETPLDFQFFLHLTEKIKFFESRFNNYFKCNCL